MNRICRRAIAVAGVLALTGGTALAAALPASAQPDLDNSSWALDASGFQFVNPVAEADSFGPQIAAIQHYYGLGPYVTIGPALDHADFDGASSNVANPHLRGIGTVVSVTATAVRSSCSSNGGSPTGSTTILGGVAGFNGTGIHLPTHPSVNQTFFVPGIGTITLNEQDNSGSELTVTAMSVESPGGFQTTDIGVSVCEDNT